jgi:hypothetical protein
LFTWSATVQFLKTESWQYNYYVQQFTKTCQKLVTLKVFYEMSRPKWSSSGVNSCGWGNCSLSALMLSFWRTVPLARMCVSLLAALCSLSCNRML